MEGALRGIQSDLLTQQSVSALLAGITMVTVFAMWAVWSRRNLARIKRIPLRILVTGTRGKSSTVRLIHAALAGAGIPTLAKMTGTASRELDTSGEERATNRIGQVSILEMLETVHHAFRRGDKPPEAIVLECMAVTPELIDLVTRDIVAPQVSIVTNALWDHLEEQGTTLQDIAASLSGAMSGAQIAITAEHRPSTLHVLVHEAHARDVTLDVVSGAEVPIEVRERLPWAHPDNIAMALAAAMYAGVDAREAIHGMRSATFEPLPDRPVTAVIDGIEWWYRDIGSVNDTDSLSPALESAISQMPADAVRLAILTTRWDRPLRAIQFAASVSPADVDGLVIVGEPDVPVRFISRHHGWPGDRILRLSTWGFGQQPLYRRLAELATRASGRSPERIALIGLENNHQYTADLIRDRFLGEGVL